MLGDADLKGADLTGASLTYAVLDGADLKGADLTCAGLDWVDLGRAKGLEAAQLKNALGGRRTTLPQYLEFEPPCYWSEYGSVEEGCAKPNCPRR